MGNTSWRTLVASAVGRAKELAYITPAGYRLAHRSGRAARSLDPVLRAALLRTPDLRRDPPAGVTIEVVGHPSRSRPIPALHDRSTSLAYRVLGRPHHLDPAALATVAPGWLVGPDGAVVTDRGRLLTTAYGDDLRIMGLDDASPLAAFVGGDGWRGPAAAAARADVPVAATLIGRLDTNYYHWLTDLLPALRWLDASQERSLADVAVAVRRAGPAFQAETLRLLGVGASRILEVDGAAPLRFDRLVVPLPSSNGVAPADDDIRWVRDGLRAGAASASGAAGAGRAGAGPRRLYIRRRAGAWRSILNETDVHAELVRHGFEALDAEDLTVAEQVARFGEAEAIVGLHGAGMTNMIFAHRPLAVTELFGTYINRCYERLASSFGHRYASIDCTPVDHDVVVDLDQLRTVIDR